MTNSEAGTTTAGSSMPSVTYRPTRDSNDVAIDPGRDLLAGLGQGMALFR